MKTFENIEIKEDEVSEILGKLSKLGVIGFTAEKLMDNIYPASNGRDWEIRISMVSAKDLPSHDDSFFTDGNNNGKCAIVPKKI